MPLPRNANILRRRRCRACRENRDESRRRWTACRKPPKKHKATKKQSLSRSSSPIIKDFSDVQKAPDKVLWLPRGISPSLPRILHGNVPSLAVFMTASTYAEASAGKHMRRTFLKFAHLHLKDTSAKPFTNLPKKAIMKVI